MQCPMYRGHIVVGELFMWCHTDTVTKKPSLYNLTKTYFNKSMSVLQKRYEIYDIIIIVFQIDKVHKVVY